MQLKQYQSEVLRQLEDFLTALVDSRKEHADIIAATPPALYKKIAGGLDFVKDAWQKTKGENAEYFAQKDGLENPLPDVYLKVPTGGGKTLLACHAIEYIQQQFLNRQTGLVLWVVPTTQIYRQTIEKLRDREHPYRQILDIASGARVVVKERSQRISPADVNHKLVILMLMLPAANRKSKETLRMFRDSGGYDSFFPNEDDSEAHKNLLAEIPNLDVCNDPDGIFPPIIKSSLGNVIARCRPLMLVDEGQKAYSEGARNTLRRFNPAFILELSATPPPNTNIVAAASGKDLDNEEMIKLDINLQSAAAADWKKILIRTKDKRDYLEKQALAYRQNANRYIRPIALIQAERTGKDQRDSKFVHAEDVREYLIANGVRPDHVAIKSSSTDDIEGVDLLAEECEVRYIITKQALQEGWDCAFAYILAVLTNPKSQTAMTQLVGRILRQPDARKTQNRALDECYVFTRHESGSEIIGSIKKELEKEGLEDLAGCISVDGKDATPPQQTESRIREKFKSYEGRIYLPQFVMVQKNKLRLMDYEADILGNIDWEQIHADGYKDISLGDNVGGLNKKIGLDNKLLDGETTVGGLDLDSVFMTRQLVEVVPNAWRAHEISEEILAYFCRKHGTQKTTDNFVHIIEQSRRLLEDALDKLAQAVFDKLINEQKLHFVLLARDGGWRIPQKIKTHRQKQLVRDDNLPPQKSLFAHNPENDFNTLEKQIALYLDEQEKLLWWYRNRARVDYRLQGWRKHKIYPDFIAAKTQDGKQINEVAVLEVKGIHLKNDDTEYKKKIFDKCNDFCKTLAVRDLHNAKKDWQTLGLNFQDSTFCFQVVYQDEWKSVINNIFCR